jgi:hypothetical protein
VRPSELDRILQEIADRCREGLLIGLDRQSVLSGLYDERDAANIGRQSGGGCNAVDEFGHGDPRSVHGTRQANFVERARNQIT